MSIYWAIIMGIVQGLTEFFPVSSSAHLSLTPWIFKFQDPGLSFDIALHAGTLFAIIIAFWTDWQRMLKSLLARKANRDNKLILFLLATSLPGFAFGYFLEDKAKTIFRTPLLTASVILVFGGILWAVDKYKKSTEKIDKMNTQKSFLIGLSQALAIIPGVSRSGATITAGRLLGFDRETAVKYSFLAAMPIILGATLYGLRNTSANDLFSSSWIIGFGFSLFSSLWAMKFLLKYVKKNNFNIFVWYRIALAILVLLIYLAR